MRQKALIITVSLVALTLLACGCLGGEQKNNETTSPLANSLLVVRSVQVMPGYNVSLSCVLTMMNGGGIDNQTVYWYLDGKPLGQSSAYFGFATYNLSIGDVSALSEGDHQIRVDYKGDADYAGTTGTGVLAVIPNPTPIPSLSPTPNPITATPIVSPSLTPTPTARPPLILPTIPFPTSFLP